MIDHGYQTARSRTGNIGAGYTLGILDVDPTGFHGQRMRGIANRVAPGAKVIFETCKGDDPGAVWRLAIRGAAVIAMPFVFPPPIPDAWRDTITNTANAGPLLFAGVGDGVPEVLFPASHPLVFACYGIDPATGLTYPRAGADHGRLDIGCVSGPDLASGATVMAAALATLALGYISHTSTDPQRWRVKVWEWLMEEGYPLPSGAWAPNCANL